MNINRKLFLIAALLILLVGCNKQGSEIIS